MKQDEPKAKEYQPIDCNYYDRLEAWATRKEKVTIELKKNSTAYIQATIVDLFVKNHVEYMKLSTGIEIRLDEIKSINNIPVPYSC